MLAVCGGYVEVIQLLLNAGATVNDKDKVCQCVCF